MKNKKVNILSQYYYPDVASTGQLLTELGGELVKHGMDVAAYTAKPAYFKKEDAPKYEVYDGIKIHRTFCINANKDKAFGRIFNTVSFISSIFIKLLFSERRAVNLIVSNPPLLHFIGYFLYVLRRQKYVLLIYDIYPDIAVVLNYFKKDSLIVKLWDWLYKKAIISSSKTIVLSEGMKERILSRFDDKKTIEEKISIIHNWADDVFFHIIPKDQNKFIETHGLKEKFVLLYSGNLALFNGFETILASTKIVNDPEVQYLIIGNGGKRKEIEEFAQSNPDAKIKMMDYQPFSDLPNSLSSGDVLFVTVKEGINGINMPSKLYTIMASGKPIIALGENNSDVHNMVNNAECGIFVKQGDVEGLVKAINYYRANPDIAVQHGLNGRRYFEENYTLNIISKQYFELLSGIN